MVSLENILDSWKISGQVICISFLFKMLDILSILHFVLLLLIFIQWIAVYYVDTVHISLLSSRLVHQNGVNLASELLRPFRQHQVEISRQEKLAVILITELVKSEDYLRLLRQVKCVYLEL